MTMELLQETLQMGCEHFGFTLSELQREQFETYARLLVEWNEKMNLTAITKPQEIAMKHFVDSLLLTKAIEVERGCLLYTSDVAVLYGCTQLRRGTDSLYADYPSFNVPAVG